LEKEKEKYRTIMEKELKEKDGVEKTEKREKKEAASKSRSESFFGVSFSETINGEKWIPAKIKFAY